ncbi:MAG: caspase family protein [Oscillatoriales cyanobacterium C42_A2020_001]|nr:caspase family protein [Leptolyngbyaceae cyanobacterium C42_A2020_001]
MASHWAIAVGINHYLQMESLPYAKQDANAVRNALLQSSTVQQVCYFADDSQNMTLDEGITILTHPTFSNLKQFLQVRFANPFLSPEDTLWFFFSGHGLHYANRDYLLPSDADPENPENTAIAVENLVECLRRCGTSKIVLLIDACHTKTQKFGQGFGTDPEGVITLFASDYNQLSQSIPALQQGAFTVALLEGFQSLSRYKNANLEHLYLYLRDRLPKLSLQHGQPIQIPRLRQDLALSPETISIPRVATKRAGVFDWLLNWKHISAANMGSVVLSPETAQSPFWKVAAGLGVASMLLGVTGYGAFQEASRLTPFNQSKPEKTTNQSSSKAASAKLNSQAAANADASSLPDLLSSSDLDFKNNPILRVPKPGIYYTDEPQFSASRREIGKRGNRLCIKLINGSRDPATRSQVIVSSISPRQDGFYIDATREKLRMNNVYTEFGDRKSVWQRLEREVDETGLMGDCLAAQSSFVRQAKGE